ncbi:N2227-domain-containing protein [Ephemerocybe angulata]|uniref:carnosine N-methyltransferase n=1 Tax=Ephemerocybe angulata TaxID=980116 RepID=A0A8H6LX88_9AGAR|nr:N2227-domain-containing protein [Tulosesus angulatus]
MPFDHRDEEAEAEEERIHFQNVITTFNNYGQYSLSANNRRRRDIYSLPLEDQDLLDSLGYKKKLDDADKAILANADFLSKIVENPEIFGHELDDEDNDEIAEPSHTHRGCDHSHDNPTGGHSHSHEQPRSVPAHSHSHEQPRSSSPHSHSNTPGHSHSHSLENGNTHGSHSHSRPRPDVVPAHSHRKKYRPTDFDMDKLRSTLKQFVRDWSAEGAAEREQCYKPLVDALLAHFPDAKTPEERSKLRVLVPGAGLGRLAWDVANIGFACQGNEFSHYMLLSSYFILNRTDGIEKHTLYPYVHSFSNVPNRQAMLRPVLIPDVSPSDLPPTSKFSLVAGDFEEIYGSDDHDPDEPQYGQWDAIMTCFFIDTAKNIVSYLRIIHKILAPGGVWINLGPLLWHFENNNTNDPSIELDLEEVKELARKIGFEISNEKTLDTTYTSNSESMLGYVYKAAFWTATKI